MSSYLIILEIVNTGFKSLACEALFKKLFLQYTCICNVKFSAE